MPDLSTRYLGLALQNPLVPSSTPISRQVDATLRLEDAGAAAIVMHSVFEEDVRGTPRQNSRGLDAYLEQIAALKSRLTIPVVASLNGSSGDGWVRLGEQLASAGANALELNAWFVVGNPEISAEAVERHYLDLLRSLKRVVKVPVALKIPPFFSALPNFVKNAEACGAAGVSLFNRFFQPDIDLESRALVHRAQLSTSADSLLAMRWIAILRGRTRLTLAASGGIHTAEDALKMLLAGADVTHVASALLLHGPQRLREMLDGIRQWMEAHEFETLTQLKGTMSQVKVPHPGAFARAAYLDTLDSFTPPTKTDY